MPIFVSLDRVRQCYDGITYDVGLVMVLSHQSLSQGLNDQLKVIATTTEYRVHLCCYGCVWMPTLLFFVLIPSCLVTSFGFFCFVLA